MLRARSALLLAGAYAKADIIKRAVKLFLQGKFDKLETLMADDAFVYVQAPADIPYSGRYTGRTCFSDFMSEFGKSLTIRSVPEVFYYLNESGSVFVAFDFELEAVADPKVQLRTSVLAKMKVNDEGKVNKVAIISDTLAAANALRQASCPNAEACNA